MKPFESGIYLICSRPYSIYLVYYSYYYLHTTRSWLTSLPRRNVHMMLMPLERSVQLWHTLEELKWPLVKSSVYTKLSAGYLLVNKLSPRLFFSKFNVIGDTVIICMFSVNVLVCSLDILLSQWTCKSCMLTANCCASLLPRCWGNGTTRIARYATLYSYCLPASQLAG